MTKFYRFLDSEPAWHYRYTLFLQRVEEIISGQTSNSSSSVLDEVQDESLRKYVLQTCIFVRELLMQQIEVFLSSNKNYFEGIKDDLKDEAPSNILENEEEMLLLSDSFMFENEILDDENLNIDDEITPSCSEKKNNFIIPKNLTELLLLNDDPGSFFFSKYLGN